MPSDPTDHDRIQETIDETLRLCGALHGAVPYEVDLDAAEAHAFTMLPRYARALELACGALTNLDPREWARLVAILNGTVCLNDESEDI